MVCEGTPIARQVERKLFQAPEPFDMLKEIEMMLEPLELSNCISPQPCFQLSSLKGRFGKISKGC